MIKLLFYNITYCIFLSSINQNIFAYERGIDQYEKFASFIDQKRIALVVNQTSLRKDQTHLIDFLHFEKKHHITKIFALEHGIRGDVDAGQDIPSGTDQATQIKIVSLYGNKKTPTIKDLSDVDVIIFDIQDIGVRTYTFISSLYLIMTAAAQNNKKMIVLDRPNHFMNQVSGPMLDPSFVSFVGIIPVPLVYGLSIGELALMIQGENWIKNKIDLEVIKMANYKRNQKVILTGTAPSPALRSDQAIYNYPTLVAFEGTTVSLGRGTNEPFEKIGHPHPAYFNEITFTPEKKAFSQKPLYLNNLCFGLGVSFKLDHGFDFSFIQKIYEKHLEIGILFFPKPQKVDLISPQRNFDLHMGTDFIRLALERKISPAIVQKTIDLKNKSYLEIRKKYLIYQ
jgi:uncharacterized protein YbbC (DUF1343 family)